MAGPNDKDAIPTLKDEIDHATVDKVQRARRRQVQIRLRDRSSRATARRSG